MGNRGSRGFTVIDLFIVIAVVGLVVAFLLGIAGGLTNVSHGEGEKVGQVVKLSKQGFAVQTWEGQLIRGGMNSGSGAFGMVPFDFTVENDDLARKVQNYMQDQTEVVAKYRIEGIYSPFRTESHGHFLISIEPAKK